MIRDFQLRQPGEKRRQPLLLIGSIVGHILLVLLPLAAALIDRWLQPEREPESINIEEMPSVGPQVDKETTRLPDDPDPTPDPPKPEPEPEPMPMPEPEVEMPPIVEEVEEPTFDLPKVQQQPKTVAEPKLDPSKFPKPPPKNRELTDKPKTPPKTGKNDNPLVPVGPKATAQTHGEKPSNTAQGGPNQGDRYTAMISLFLKQQWKVFAPSLANARSDASVGVRLAISPDGRLVRGEITRSSGNAEMDAAAQRLLDHLKTIQLPKNPDGKSWENTVNFGTKFNNW